MFLQNAPRYSQTCNALSSPLITSSINSETERNLIGRDLCLCSNLQDPHTQAAKSVSIKGISAVSSKAVVSIWLRMWTIKVNIWQSSQDAHVSYWGALIQVLAPFPFQPLVNVLLNWEAAGHGSNVHILLSLLHTEQMWTEL